MASGVQDKAGSVTAVSPGRGSPLTHWLAPFAIVLLGLGLRLFRLDGQSFWYDEAIQVSLSSKGIRKSMINVAQGAENCPPLSHGFFGIWLKFGDSDFWVRLLPALVGVIAIYYMYLLALRLAGRKIALTAAFLLAISPFHLWYSQEARPYSFLVLFSIAGMYYFLTSIETNSRWSRFMYVCSTVGALYMHPFAVFTIATQFLYVLLYVRQPRTAMWARVLDVSIPMLLYVPWILHMLTIADRAAGYEKPVGLASLLYAFYTFSLGFSVGPSLPELHVNTSVRAFFPYLKVILPFAAVYAFLSIKGIVAGKCSPSRVRMLLLMWLIIPIIGGYVLTLCTQVTFNVRYISTSVVPYLTIVALGIASLGRVRWHAVALAAVTICCGYSLRNYYFDPTYYKEDIRGAAAYIDRTARANDAVMAVDIRTFVRYYRGAAPLVNLDDAESEVDTTLEFCDLEQYRFRRLWLVYSREWLIDPEGRLMPELASRYTVLEEHSFPHVQVVLYDLWTEDD